MRIRQRLDGFDSRAAAACERRAGRLADAVDDEDRGRIETGRIVRRSGVREVMGNELQCATELPPENPVGSVADLIEAPQEFHLQLAVRPPVRVKFRAAKLRIERVRHPVDLGSPKSRMIQTKAYRLLGKLVRIVDLRFLGMLDAIEPLFLAGRHDLAVDNQCGRRFMKHSVDTENVHPAGLCFAMLYLGTVDEEFGTVDGAHARFFMRVVLGIVAASLGYSAFT